MRIPLIVIVGRPNVGKSTLFNRLTKSKTAIVDDVSGVTRDRIYGEVEWNGKKFRVIDTGGYVPDSVDYFEAAIREQVQIGIEEADAIFFVVDGKAGISPIDEDVAKLLRTSSKPAFLLVNKLDNPGSAYNTSDFYRLGLKNVYDIAAINGRNLGDLLDDLLDELDFDFTEVEEDERLRIAILGRPNVGKSSLTNSLLGFDRSIVTDIPGTTRDSVDSVLKYYGEEIVLVDTAGLRRKAKVHENIEFYSNVRTYQAIAGSDLAIVLIDAKIGVDKQDMKILEEAIRRRKGLILAVNKWDLVEKETNTSRDFELTIREKIAMYDYIPIIFISALTKQRIYKLIDLAKEIHTERKKKIPTSELNDKLLPEFAQNPPPSTPTGKEVKIRYITQVGDHYPIFLIFANESKYLPEHYRRFAERTIRRQFGFEGVPITVTIKSA